MQSNFGITFIGIELLNANEQLKREDAGQLMVVNEATGEETDFSHPNLPDQKSVKVQKPSFP